jgi:Ras-related GTP-binding protein A/B
MENYFESQRDQIFRNVEVLIYVFDIESAERKKDIEQFENCISAIKQNSKNAHIFCLIHKMDLIQKEDEKMRIFEERDKELKKIAEPMKITCFGTSIWDETLYKAWSSIVYALVPNVDMLESHLNKFCSLCSADEVVLFEKATFLVISHATHKQHADVHRYEKISNIIKQFKLSCSKTQAQFKSMEVKNQYFTALIDVFTTNTYIMIIVSDEKIQSAATNMNISAARPHFEKFVQQNMY